MDTLTLDRHDPGPGGFDDESLDDRPSRRPRRRLLNRRSAALAAVVTCAGGFYAGVRVEKGQLASTPRTGAGATTPAAAGAGAAGRTGRAGAGLGLGAGRGAPGGGASFGTVQSIDGDTLVLSEASGNTVKVRLSSATRVSKSEAVKPSAVRPGDTIIVAGAANSRGTLVAASVTDSGAGAGSRTAGTGAAGTGAAGTGAGGSGSSASGSAVGSLFSSRGGG